MRKPLAFVVEAGDDGIVYRIYMCVYQYLCVCVYVCMPVCVHVRERERSIYLISYYITNIFFNCNIDTYIENFPFTVEMITMMNGRTRMVHDGYTFFYRYTIQQTQHQKWCCTRFPKCKAFLLLRDQDVRRDSVFEHNHGKDMMYRCTNGRYTKLRN